MRKQLYLIAIILSGLFALNSCTISEFEKHYGGSWHLVYIDSEYGDMETLFVGNGSITFNDEGVFQTPYYFSKNNLLCNVCKGEWKVLNESFEGSKALIKINVDDALFNGLWDIEITDVKTGQPRYRMTMKKKSTNTIVVAEVFKQ